MGSEEMYKLTYPHVFAQAICDSGSSQLAIAQCWPLSTQVSLHKPQRFGHMRRPIAEEQSPREDAQRASFLFLQLISVPYLKKDGCIFSLQGNERIVKDKKSSKLTLV